MYTPWSVCTVATVTRDPDPRHAAFAFGDGHHTLGPRGSARSLQPYRRYGGIARAFRRHVAYNHPATYQMRRPVCPHRESSRPQRSPYVKHTLSLSHTHQTNAEDKGEQISTRRGSTQPQPITVAQPPWRLNERHEFFLAACMLQPPYEAYFLKGMCWLPKEHCYFI